MKIEEFGAALGHDVRYSVRVLWSSPGFTLIVVLTLALGVGANTAMFSVVNAVLLHPLPYPEPTRLVRLAQATNQEPITVVEYKFWKEHSNAFSSIAGYRVVNERHLVVNDEQQWIKAMAVTADFFHTLGTTPAIGREFISAEEHAGAPQAIMLSDRLYRELFNNEAQVLGRFVRLDNTSYMVVGVLPRDFWFPQAADAFVSLQSAGETEDRGTNVSVIARLRAGVALKQARAETASLVESFRTFAGSRSTEYRNLTITSYQDWLVGSIRLNLLLLFTSTGLLFLMVCSNLASLLLARFAAREKEIAVRFALGSSGWQLLRQFLIENIVLTSLGIAAGVLGAYAILSTLVAMIPFHLSTSAPIRVDGNVLAFAIGIFFMVALMFTLLAVLNSRRLKVCESLKSAGRVAGMGMRHQRIRTSLVVGQVATSAMLLITAGLLIRTLYHIRQEPLGFRPQGLVTFATSLAADRYPDPASVGIFATTVSTRIQALPGILGVAAINVLPLTGGINLPSEHEGHPDQSIGGMEIRLVTPDYFKVMGIPLRQGRSFSEGDNAVSPPVAVVNESLVRLWWPQGGGLGERIVIGRYQGKDFQEIKDTPREIVGIANDTKTVNFKEAARPTIFLPLPQAKAVFIKMSGKLAWIVRANNLAALPDELRRVVADFDSSQSVQQFRTMEEVVTSTTANSRFDAWLFGTFAGLALVLAAVGVYGVLSFSVAYRRQEIGTRMALGASRASVLGLFMKQGLALIVIGLSLGLVGALFLTRSLATLLYGITPNDPLSFLGVSVVLLLVGVIASYVPSSRATKIDPLIAIRCD